MAYPVYAYYFNILAFIIFIIGIYGYVRSHNAVKMLISIELMLNAANLNFAAFALYTTKTLEELAIGQVAVLFMIGLAAVEAAIGLAIILIAYKNFGHVDAARMNTMKY